MVQEIAEADNFPQVNLLQSFLTPQGTISPFTGKGRKQCHCSWHHLIYQPGKYYPIKSKHPTR
jgi:hypothetical protein